MSTNKPSIGPAAVEIAHTYRESYVYNNQYIKENVMRSSKMSLKSKK